MHCSKFLRLIDLIIERMRKKRGFRNRKKGWKRCLPESQLEKEGSFVEMVGVKELERNMMCWEMERKMKEKRVEMDELAVGGKGRYIRAF